MNLLRKVWSLFKMKREILLRKECLSLETPSFAIFPVLPSFSFSIPFLDSLSLFSVPSFVHLSFLIFPFPSCHFVWLLLSPFPTISLFHMVHALGKRLSNTFFTCWLQGKADLILHTLPSKKEILNENEFHDY